MSEVYLHIGIHKTGSTFLQEKVFPLFKSITYLTRPYTQHNFAFNKLQYADESLYQKEDVLKELDKINAKRILISDESFSGKPLNFSYINRSTVANRLKEIFPDAKVMIFIRGQKDILLSHYSQYISQSGYKSIDQLIWYPKEDYTYEMFRKNNRAYNPSTLYYNTNDFYLHLDCFLYFELITMYKSLFKHVEVYLYEDFKRHPDQIIRSIEHLFEEKLSLASKMDTKHKVNASIKADSLQMKRFQNRLNALTDKKAITIPLSMIYKYIFRNFSNSNFETTYVEKVARDFYRENNRKIIHHFKAIPLQNYPEYYSV